MLSDRLQRRIDAFLDEADAAAATGDWSALAEKARAVLAIDQENADARGFLKMAEANLTPVTGQPAAAPPPVAAAPATNAAPPSSFANGRYAVRKFLGEGGKKKVFLAHDSLLDRDVAFALIKTDGLDLIGRERITREAQAMGRLGAHPHIVSIFDLGEHDGQPFVVTELMGGGDVEGLLEKADGPLPLERSLEIAKAVARGLVFAHGKGIIHRDLKPGNVWLTADGVAKIGDFGLAVALDKSRLTVHGMMVGTVNYMPPEQALGGEVTPRADLYSLGAMLYEMVTGKPPFAGGDATAIISQHINTPPVAPSWQTSNCPPALEELILGLLAKSPSERPASAEDVLRQLDAIDPTAPGKRHSDTAANPLDRLARGVFVGRGRELDQLRRAFDEAFAGRGSLVMLVGEPGIGKTRTAQELETYAKLRGAQVLWGRAHESSGAPPYWPWLQVGNGFSANTDLASLATPGDDTLGELSRLFPRLRQVIPNLPEPLPIADAESAQFRLFDAYATFVSRLSTTTPAMLVLDDVHWADRPSLLLLQHVARELARMRVLLVCTYRDTELARTHPLSETLAALNREAGFLRLPLRGLTRPEVADYIRTTANVDPAHVVLDRIFEETEGNPFFLSEVVNLLTQEGTLAKDSLSDISIPDGVREALGRRLDRVSEATNGLLTMAAVVGREFTYDTLTLLGEADDDALLKQIEEAVAARVIEEMEQPGRYRFTHALMQETLLAELSTTRRVRLQGQVGEALERRWGDRADEHAARLAEHFFDAATLSRKHAEKAVHYGKTAAEQAEAVAAWDDAADTYERCLGLVTDSDDRLGQDEAALLAALGRCERDCGRWNPAWRHLTQAIALYQQNGDSLAGARVVLDALLLERPPGAYLPILEPAIAAARDVDPYIEAQLLVELIDPRVDGVDPERRRAAGERLDHLLELHDFEDVRARAWFRNEVASPLYSPERGREMADSARKAFEVFSRLGRVPGAARSLQAYALTLHRVGNVDSLLEAMIESFEYSSRHRYRFVEGWSFNMLAQTLTLRCDWGRIEDLVERHAELAQNVDAARRRQLELAGELNDVYRRYPVEMSGIPWVDVGPLMEQARIFLHQGRRDDAKAAFALARAALDRQPNSFEINGVRLFPPALYGDDAITELADDEFIAAVEIWLENDHAGFLMMGSTRRLVADIKLNRRNDLDAAEALFARALAWSEEQRCPVEAGRCHLGLAEVAERRGDHVKALEHLELAGPLFSEHGAKFYLDQVLAKKEILKA